MVWIVQGSLSLSLRLRIHPHLNFSSTVPIFYSCTKCVSSSGIIYDRTQHPVSLAWMTPKNERSFDSKAWLTFCAWPYFDILPMGVCIIKHWQTSGRLVQELNVCTMHAINVQKNISIGIYCLVCRV